ncbi:DUF2809 domain-containing protein [Cryobacterium sp. PH29-G1]|uniref:ribosomal maturation YjgA family protein n=1 Tax=Cryobacterium sp. PH29-G1 TaxID=3046211 RepID=UPI0024BAFFFA|nr:DUF2809 domain-containing protein [Cryobacterium sp. PH29-G1]MDJ0349576.1 DUF2809 domain-containing protein [Cryobacterium sp. PH29-G1]
MFKARRRPIVAAAGVAVVCVGLIVHFTAVGAAADFFADALYAVLIYLLSIFCLPRIAPTASAVLTYGFCLLIELAQLTGGPAALAVAFPPARLILGTTFAPVDLMAYAVGVAVVWAGDALVAARGVRRA